MKRALLFIVAVLILGGLYLAFGKQPPALEQNSQSHQLLKPGDLAVIHEELLLTDRSRGIDKNGDYEGANERTFTVDLWRGDGVQGGPLLIYSHGFMSTGRGGDYLGKHLASLGYTVAAPTYPLTNFNAPGGPNPADVVNQIDDVRFVIDSLLARNADQEDALYNSIDPTRIAAAGLSLGGMTTELVAYHPRRADQRIVAAISIAGPTYTFTRRFFAERSIPFMMVATPIDAMVPYADNAANIQNKIPGAVLVTIENGSHAGFGSQAKWLRWFSNPDSLGCDALMENIDLSSDQTWYHKIGSPEDGVIEADAPRMCRMNPIPAAMNPLRQHQLNTLAVSSFLQCHFADQKDIADANCEFLKTVFADEIPEVSVSIDQSAPSADEQALNTEQILNTFADVRDDAAIQDSAGSTAVNHWYADGRFINHWQNANDSGTNSGRWSARDNKRCVLIESGMESLVGRERCGSIYRRGSHYVTLNPDGSVHALHSLSPIPADEAL